MNKRLFYIIAGIMLFSLVILVAINAALNSGKQPTKENIYATPSVSPGADGATGGQAETSPAADQAGPEIAAKAFYEWYRNHPNPLGSGEYLSNPNISEDYKDSMKGFVAVGDHIDSDPVLTCVGVKPPQNISAQAATYDPSRLQASVLLNEGNRSVYEVLLKNINQKWLIDDVRCYL